LIPAFESFTPMSANDAASDRIDPDDPVVQLERAPLLISER